MLPLWRPRMMCPATASENRDDPPSLCACERKCRWQQNMKPRGPRVCGGWNQWLSKCTDTIVSVYQPRGPLEHARTQTSHRPGSMCGRTSCEGGSRCGRPTKMQQIEKGTWWEHHGIMSDKKDWGKEKGDRGRWKISMCESMSRGKKTEKSRRVE